MKSGRHCIISGRVQGVFFRQGTCAKAEELRITGWVRNLPDKSVECMAYGEAQLIEKFCEWLHKGPPAARVKEVKIEEIPWEMCEDFKVIR